MNENEIYGWLIGYLEDNIPKVLAIVECKRFEQQSLISAIPHAQEFQEISSVMPQGIGPIGIYHSHPFSSKIFHSHTDDSTLLSLSNQFPSCISIVTNGEEINYYQMGKKNKTEEIQAEFIDPDIPKFLLISIEEKLLLKINNRILNNRADDRKLKIMILNKIKDYLEYIWKDFELSYNNSKISKNDSIKPYLVNNLKAKPVQLILPKKFKERNKIKLIIDTTGESGEFNFNQVYTYLSLNINAKIPIYTTEENGTFQKINQTIKTELLSNNILQKVYICVVDYDKNIIITPDDLYLNFFGFYIKLLYLNRKELKQSKLSQRNFELLTKFTSLFDSFSDLELSNKIKNQIQTFLNDVKIFSQKFSWYDEIKEILNLQ